MPAIEVSDQEMIDTIKRLHAKNNYPPTYQEVADVVGYNIRTVLERIHLMVNEGKLSIRGGRGNSSTRTLRVVGHNCKHCGGSGYNGI